MVAMQCERKGEGALSLVKVDRERPRPGRGQVLIEVAAAGVTQTELRWWPTTHHEDGTARTDAVPAHEFSGVIAAVGEDVHEWSAGQRVYGMNDWFDSGALAEFCLASSSSIASKPAALSDEEAATVPIGSLTSLQGLLDHARLQAGEDVLVVGGAGGVGMFAVQVACLHGARVTATTSASTLEFVRSLGAKRVVDYRSPEASQIGSYDVVFDTVGGPNRDRLAKMLRAGGRLVSIAADAEVTSDPVARAAYFIVQPNQKQLTEVTSLFDNGELQTFVRAVVPLERAGEAYLGGLEEAKGYGKVVVRVGTRSSC